jgi:hypothetical protein
LSFRPSAQRESRNPEKQVGLSNIFHPGWIPGSRAPPRPGMTGC